MEKIQSIQRIFVERGTEVPAFIHDGKRVGNPLDERHLWIVEPDYVFSVRTHKLEADLIRRGTDAKGNVTLSGGFLVWRVRADEEIRGLLNGLKKAK